MSFIEQMSLRVSDFEERCKEIPVGGFSSLLIWCRNGGKTLQIEQIYELGIIPSIQDLLKFRKIVTALYRTTLLLICT